jgi:elongation factor 1-beta
VKVAEKQQEHTSVIHALLKDLKKMARLSLRAKILPSGSEINLDEVAKKIQGVLKEGITLSRYTKEPLAFGLYFINAEFALDDKEGQMDSLENAIRSIEGVGEFEVLGLSRTSVDMK